MILEHQSPKNKTLIASVNHVHAIFIYIDNFLKDINYYPVNYRMYMVKNDLIIEYGDTTSVFHISFENEKEKKKILQQLQLHTNGAI